MGGGGLVGRGIRVLVGAGVLVGGSAVLVAGGTVGGTGLATSGVVGKGACVAAGVSEATAVGLGVREAPKGGRVGSGLAVRVLVLTAAAVGDVAVRLGGAVAVCIAVGV